MRAWLATAGEEALREIQAVMDRHAHIAPEATEQAISKAIGEELRSAREAMGWSRAQLCARLPSGIGDRTLLSYEHGVRNLTVLRLIELSIALDVSASMVLGNGLQRARLHLEHMTLRVVLRDLIADESTAFRSMRQWAKNKLHDTPSGVAEVDPGSVREMAAFIGCTHPELARYLAKFSPPRNPDTTDGEEVSP